MTTPQANSPLHGKTLETIVNHLPAHFGRKELGLRNKVRCFTDNPSIQSSLKFLRKISWAQENVETLYLESIEGSEN